MTALALNTSQIAFPQRLADAARTLLFLVVSLPLGVAYLAALPIAALAGPAALRRMLELERALVNGLLGARIPAPPPTADASVGRHQIAFLVAKLPISACAAAFCALPAALFAERLIAAALRNGGFDALLTLGGAVIAQPALQALQADHPLGRLTYATFGIGPQVLNAIRAGQMASAVDQQPFLQGYLPIVLLTQYRLYGILPDRGRLISTPSSSPNRTLPTSSTS